MCSIHIRHTQRCLLTRKVVVCGCLSERSSKRVSETKEAVCALSRGSQGKSFPNRSGNREARCSERIQTEKHGAERTVKVGSVENNSSNTCAPLPGKLTGGRPYRSLWTNELRLPAQNKKRVWIRVHDALCAAQVFRVGELDEANGGLEGVRRTFLTSWLRLVAKQCTNNSKHAVTSNFSSKQAANVEWQVTEKCSMKTFRENR